MPHFRRDQVTFVVKFIVVLVIFIIVIAVVRSIPGAARVLHAIARYLFLLGSAIALYILAVIAMWKMYREKDVTSLVRSIFGFLAGGVLALMTEAWVMDPSFVEEIFSGLSIRGIYLSCIGFGVVFSEIGTFTRRAGHFLLVFLCSAIAGLLIDLLTLPTTAIDFNWLLAFLFGVAVDQMFRFRLNRDTVRALPPAPENEQH